MYVWKNGPRPKNTPKVHTVFLHFPQSMEKNPFGTCFITKWSQTALLKKKKRLMFIYPIVFTIRIGIGKSDFIVFLLSDSGVDWNVD